MDCKEYDKKFYVFPDEIAHRENELLGKILEDLNLTENICLDFGCGTGYWTSVFNRLRIKCIGVDISEKVVKECGKKYPNYQFVLLADAKIPFPDYCFDFILSAWVFQEITEDEIFFALLNELKRVLKVGGKFLIVDNEYPNARIFCKSTEYGDLFLGDNEFGRLRFFQDSTAKKVMGKIDLRMISRQFVGNSFFEVYEK